MSERKSSFPPKIIWLLWLQGWDSAPAVARACRNTWESRNPGWAIQCLDLRTLAHFLPADIVESIMSTPKEAEALSDQIRLELLHRYGGVWADATFMCAAPLDDWLVDVMPYGFFAFARPGPDRMVSTWFLAAEKGSYIVERWRSASVGYWAERTERDDYFWVHQLFASVYETDFDFRELWDGTPQISAAHRFHFGPNSADLLAPPPADLDDLLKAPPAPVFKLTHKFENQPSINSLFARLCADAEDAQPSSRPFKRRLPVSWFGSFSGHGTIGDLRSLETIVSHLVGRGHEVFHATADSINISGAIRVDWRQFTPDACDVVIFVCGPILLNHKELTAFFEHFATAQLVGVGVSLMAEGHPNYRNPFCVTFARQGGAEPFGDVAICAPHTPSHRLPSRSNDKTVIGLALRGEQHEYGSELCLWREASQMFAALVDLLARHSSVRIVEIENHLLRSRRTADAIEEQYAACDLVLTTRYYGGIAALRKNVPFIALDQISNGAKVMPLLAGFGWEAVFRVDTVSTLDIVRLGLELLRDPQTMQLVKTRCRHVREANRTLAYVDRWLDDIDGH
ncbi:capsular polysaccharide synthesis protein [Erythrobacter sp. R86502]|uniref:capsular polysaccharide synthesis protein n=1 Tax=Erythrobacter sp. R86502 TaxID=3093846 RepID=UPI0036D3A7E2